MKMELEIGNPNNIVSTIPYELIKDIPNDIKNEVFLGMFVCLPVLKFMIKTKDKETVINELKNNPEKLLDNCFITKIVSNYTGNNRLYRDVLITHISHGLLTLVDGVEKNRIEVIDLIESIGDKIRNFNKIKDIKVSSVIPYGSLINGDITFIYGVYEVEFEKE